MYYTKMPNNKKNKTNNKAKNAKREAKRDAECDMAPRHHLVISKRRPSDFKSKGGRLTYTCDEALFNAVHGVGVVRLGRQ